LPLVSNTGLDSDSDSLSDVDEVNIHGTDPLEADTDGDGLFDDAEINTHGTDPLLVDTDGDSISDRVEVENGLDPLVSNTDGIGPNGERVVVVDGGTDPVSWYLPGTNVSIIAELRDGFYFSHWTGDADVLADFRDALPSFIMPHRNVSLTANYLPVQEFTYSCDQSGAMAEPVWGLAQNSTNYFLFTQEEPGYSTLISQLDKNFSGYNQEQLIGWDGAYGNTAWLDVASCDEDSCFVLETQDYGDDHCVVRRYRNNHNLMTPNIHGVPDYTSPCYGAGVWCNINAFGIGYDEVADQLVIASYDGTNITTEILDFATYSLTNGISFPLDSAVYGTPSGLEVVNMNGIQRLLLGTKNQQDNIFARKNNFILDIDARTGEIGQFAKFSGDLMKLEDLSYSAGRLATGYLAGTSGQIMVAEFTPFTRPKIGQTIEFPALPVKTYGAAPFELEGRADSDLPVVFQCLEESVAIVSNGWINIVGAGDAWMVASQIGDVNFAAAEPITNLLTVLPRELSVTNLIVLDKKVDGSAVAMLSGASLFGVVSGDEVFLSNAITGTFAQATLGLDIPVSTVLTLIGAEAANYSLEQPTNLTACIYAEIIATAPTNGTVNVGSTDVGTGAVTNRIPLQSADALYAFPSTGYCFDRWLGTLESTANPLDYSGTESNLDLTARFMLDPIYSNWISRFGSGALEIPLSDTDLDGLNNWGEYIAGSNPTNPASTSFYIGLESGTLQFLSLSRIDSTI